MKLLKTGSSAARQAMRSAYPNKPLSNDALEVQQMALLEQQEKQLKKLKKCRFNIFSITLNA